jgi:hypothetical protein
MKFLCVPCDQPMQLQKTSAAGVGSLSLRFRCSSCDSEVAMLTNAGETQLVQSLGVRVGRSEAAVPAMPMAQLRTHLAGDLTTARIEDTASEPIWTAAAEEQLARHPRFVQPVIRRTYTDYALREGVSKITPEVMEAARRAMG